MNSRNVTRGSDKPTRGIPTSRNPRLEVLIQTNSLNAIINAHKEQFHAIAWQSPLDTVFLVANQHRNFEDYCGRTVRSGNEWTVTNQRGPYVSSRALFGSQHRLQSGLCHSSGRTIVRAEGASPIPC
jgi:hypothetical protein